MIVRITLFLLLLIGVGCTKLDFKLSDNKTMDSVKIVDTTKIPQVPEHLIDSLNILKFDSLYSVSKIDAERVYYAIKKWSIYYKIPEEMLFGIAWKETTWGGKTDSVYSIRNRIIEANTACNGTMQVIWSTGVSISKMYNIPLKDRAELRYNIMKNVQISAALLHYLNTLSNDPYTIFVNYNGHPSFKYAYASSVMNHIKIKYSVDSKYLQSKLTKRK